MSAPGEADPRGVAMFGPIRRMDEIDAAREVSVWLEATALSLPRIPNEQITTERADSGVRVYWRDNRPYAVMLTIRDGLNFTFGVGFDLSALTASQARVEDLERQVAAARAEARAEALEAAAKIADADDGNAPGGNMDFGPNVARRIAIRIRALSPEVSP